MFGELKTWAFRVRLSSGRIGQTGVLANNFTSAVELAEMLFPGAVMTIPQEVSGKYDKERTDVDGEDR
uniref:Uncharacterized protein n=1 Tax=Ochrobactrum phage ORM_20 TaxID=2985243 RepID=A0A9N6WV44_9VIRU|nr:hypothetical protein ORM20_00209 [Ochrobactrum phage ORM_20]